LIIILGNVLLSHTVASAVPSGLKGLTSVFGMGTGVSPSLQSPKRPWGRLQPAIQYRRARAHSLTLCPG
jgi:hypothetical protein